MKIESIRCPTVSLPDSFRQNHKRERGDMGWDRDGSTSLTGDSTHKKISKRRKENDYSADKAEFLNVMKSIKEISATSFEGMSKKKYKEEKLIALGAPKVKEQTMPFKMKMGILAGRKRREVREIHAAKESGLILPMQAKKRGYNRSDDAGPGLDVHTKKGILHLNRNLGGIGSKGRR